VKKSFGKHREKEILRNPFFLLLSPKSRFLSNRNYQPRHSWAPLAVKLLKICVLVHV
jgi:hypothetical protein